MPSTPAEAIARSPQMGRRIARWDRDSALSTLAALQLDPRLHVHSVRLYWASRLVAGLAKGGTRPGRSDLQRLLNADFGRSDISRFEDPSEDLFLQTVSTRRGDTRLICGTWAHPTFYTETLLEAAERIADERDLEMLSSVHALLLLSDLTAERAGLGLRVPGSGRQWGDVPVPPDTRLFALTAQPNWSASALASAKLEPALIERFIIEDGDLPPSIDSAAGRAALDTRPLLRTPTGILLAIPSAVSLAVRAAIVDHMLETGREQDIGNALLAVQAERLAETGFANLEGVPTRWSLGEATRSLVREEAPGRYVHLELIAGRLSGWREAGFPLKRTAIETYYSGCRMIPDIDFSKIRAERGDQREGFEEFSAQIFHRESVAAGSSYERYRGAGGDGGVEAIWRLPAAKSSASSRNTSCR